MTWDETKQTAVDEDNPNANEQLTATDWNDHVREQKAGRFGEWVVYEDGGTWYAEGPDGATETSGSAPGAVLQHAADNASLYVHLRDSVPDTNEITTTVTLPSGVSFIGPGLRGTSTVYGSADPVFKMEGGGFFGHLWLRKDVSSAMGTGDGIVFEGLGRGSEIRGVNVTRTNGNGIVMNGCQQMSVYGLYFAACGNPANDTGELRLDNHPDDGLETNAVNFYGMHSHGGADPQGSLIQMRASNHPDNDRPRNIRINGINLENGPSSAVPVIEICGRNNHIENARIQGLDDASTVFQLQAPRARDCTFTNLSIIGGDATAPTHGFSNAGASAASSQSGVDWAPIVNKALIDVPGIAVFLDSFNQTGTPLYVSNLWNPANNSGGNALIDVLAAKDATPGVFLSNIDANGASISIQGTRLSVSEVRNTTWTSQSAEFGPRLIADDGSFTPRFVSANTSSGVASVTFSGDFELKDGIAHATAPRGSGTVVQGVELDDNNGDGDLDRVRANVLNVDDGTNAADGTTIEFEIVPIAP